MPSYRKYLKELPEAELEASETEWRYAEVALKDILMSAGHICQNLYLACEAIGAGTCAIAAYRQDELDAFIGVDGVDEIAIYLAPVGKV